MRPFPTLCAAVAALALTSGLAHAQTREGFYFGAGAGWGSAKATCEDCNDLDNGRLSSLTAHLRVGKTISSRLAVGAELNGWFKHDDLFDTDLRLYDATLGFSIYPSDAGLFVKAGVGIGRMEITGGDLGEKVSGTGLGLMAGVGYDIPIGSTTALTPMATYWWGKPGDLKFEGVPLDLGVKHNVLEIGVGITFY